MPWSLKADLLSCGEARNSIEKKYTQMPRCLLLLDEGLGLHNEGLLNGVHPSTSDNCLSFEALPEDLEALIMHANECLHPGGRC